MIIIMNSILLKNKINILILLFEKIIKLIIIFRNLIKKIKIRHKNFKFMIINYNAKIIILMMMMI